MAVQGVGEVAVGERSGGTVSSVQNWTCGQCGYRGGVSDFAGWQWRTQRPRQAPQGDGIATDNGGQLCNLCFRLHRAWKCRTCQQLMDRYEFSSWLDHHAGKWWNRGGKQQCNKCFRPGRRLHRCKCFECKQTKDVHDFSFWFECYAPKPSGKRQCNRPSARGSVDTTGHASSAIKQKACTNFRPGNKPENRSNAPTVKHAATRASETKSS